MLLRASVLGLVISALVAASAVWAGATAPDARPPGGTTGPATVTLITGDRVTLTPADDGEPLVTFEPARASEPTGFSVHRDGARIEVIPDDVAALVPDVLDPALFDVAGLVEMGYDDASTDELPLIVRGERGVALRRSATRLESLAAAAVVLDKDDAPALGDDLSQETRIWLDRKVEGAALDHYLTQVRAPAAWGTGLDGSGVRVAVLDTGVDDAHPALAGRVDAHRNFTDSGTPADRHGHGTHVASLVAGSGAGSDGARQGIAAGADLISGKVLGDDNQGRMSWVIAGMEWAAAQGADVVNLSLGAPPTPTDDPMVQALDRLTAETGALFVVAAGNLGSFGDDPYTIATPGSAASALTVGAVTPTDLLATFSSQGPTLSGDRVKPDVVAPGVDILGARAGAQDYVPMSGSSQATPIVAGAAALLRQRHPNWSWRRIKATIVGTADLPPFHTAWTSGGGRLDLEQAAHQDLTAERATIDFGYLRHPDDAPKTRTVTLVNDGGEPVTVSVSDDLTSADRVPAPDAALTASPATLTVPAGGTAEANVRLEPGLIEDGLWQGGVTFTAADGTRLRLPVGVHDEPEMYDFTVRVLDRNGRPYDPSLGADDPNGEVAIVMFDGETGRSFALRPDEHGVARDRIPPGSYGLFAHVITPAGAGRRETYTIAGTPELVVRSDTEYVIDARDAVRLRPPRVAGQETEPEGLVGVTYHRRSGTIAFTDFSFFDAQEVADGRIYITPTGTVREGAFETTFKWRLAPAGRIRPGAPDAYELLFNDPRFPDPLSPALSRRDVADLAEVDLAYRPVGPPGEYARSIVFASAVTDIGLLVRAPQPVPGSTELLVTAAPDVRWAHCLGVPANAAWEMCRPVTVSYRRGERVREEFGAALRPQVWEARHDPFTMFFGAGLGDGDGHASVLDAEAFDSSTFSLWRNGALVGRQEGNGVFFPDSGERGSFRLRHDVTLRDAFPRSRRSRTVWAFRSAQGGVPPLLMIDYEADTDLLGRVNDRRTLRLTLRADHVSGAEAPERIDRMRLWWSTDGGRRWEWAWTRRRGQASFEASVRGTALRTGTRVSLRAVAEDAAGNEIDQTVQDIFPVD
jgi:subtilisin family serine protease